MIKDELEQKHPLATTINFTQHVLPTRNRIAATAMQFILAISNTLINGNLSLDTVLLKPCHKRGESLR